MVFSFRWLTCLSSILISLVNSMLLLLTFFIATIFDYARNKMPASDSTNQTEYLNARVTATSLPSRTRTSVARNWLKPAVLYKLIATCSQFLNNCHKKGGADRQNNQYCNEKNKHLTPENTTYEETIGVKVSSDCRGALFCRSQSSTLI